MRITWMLMMAGIGSIGNAAHYIPTDWVDFVPELYPISRAPTPIKKEFYSALSDLQAHPEETFRITAFGASPETVEKVVLYFIERHQIPRDRFIVEEKFDLPEMDGWIAIQRSSEKIALNTPDWEVSTMTTSLASPERLPESSTEASMREIRKLRPVSFRPQVGMAWYNIQTDRKLQDRIRGDWIGVRAAADTTFYRHPYFETGIGGHFFGSLLGMNGDANRSSVSEASLGGFFVVKPEPAAIGAYQFKLNSGFFGNWRQLSSGERGSFLEPFRGLNLGLEVSTSFDDQLRFGLSGSFVFDNEGVIQVGGFISHRIFTTGPYPWDVRFGLGTALARVRQGGRSFDENWSTFQFGLTASI